MFADITHNGTAFFNEKTKVNAPTLFSPTAFLTLIPAKQLHNSDACTEVW